MLRTKLKNVTFANWLVNHCNKESEEQWLRELYPWPVIAQVDCGKGGFVAYNTAIKAT